jgi:hypothetical protein
MTALRLQAMMANDPRDGIKAVEALGAYGEAAVPKLISISDFASLADNSVKQAANYEIEKIKKGLKP